MMVPFLKQQTRLDLETVDCDLVVSRLIDNHTFKKVDCQRTLNALALHHLN